MQLYNIKTGLLWKGEPVDARELLNRGGWSREPVTVGADKEQSPIVSEPVAEHSEEIVANEPKRRRGRPSRKPIQEN